MRPRSAGIGLLLLAGITMVLGCTAAIEEKPQALNSDIDPAMVVGGLWRGKVEVPHANFDGEFLVLFTRFTPSAERGRWRATAFFVAPRWMIYREIEADIFGEIVVVRFEFHQGGYGRLVMTRIAGERWLQGNYIFKAGNPVGYPMRLSRVKPDPSGSFRGAWVGSWGDGQVETALVVGEADGTRARTIYLWGAAPHRGINRPGAWRVTGSLEGEDTLRLTLQNGAQVLYRLAADKQTLSAQYVLNGRVTDGVLKLAPPGRP